MQKARTSHVMFGVGGFLLLISPLILSREGQILFAGMGAILVAMGLYLHAPKR